VAAAAVGGTLGCPSDLLLLAPSPGAARRR